MDQLELNVILRDKFGKGYARRMRKTGMIPAVVYSDGKSTAISLNQREMVKMLSTSAGENVIFQLNLQGAEKKDRKVMVKDLQVDPVKGSLVHVDFYEVRMDKPVMVNVPIALDGHATKVEGKGGIVELILREVEVECLPGDIPANIAFDISELDFGDVLYVSDIKVPKGVKVLNKPNEAFLTISSTRVEEEVPAVEGVEAEEKKEKEEKEEVEAEEK